LYADPRQEAIGALLRRAGAGGFLARMVVRELPNILRDHETIERVVRGSGPRGAGILAASTKRLILVDRRPVYGMTVEDFPYEAITGIQYRTGARLGEITILVPGTETVIRKVRAAEVKPRTAH
jgi:hypothetical protein